MKCWNEKNAFSSYFDSKNNSIVDLGVFNINGIHLYGNNKRQYFKEICINEVKKIFISNTVLDKYNLYLFANIEIKNKESKIENYKKVWKSMQSKWDLSNFRKGCEIKQVLNDILFYTSFAEFSLDELRIALEIISSNPYKFTIIASKRNIINDNDTINYIFNSAFNLNKFCNIDYINLCSNICNEDFIVFRWGDSSEEAELALILKNDLLNNLI